MALAVGLAVAKLAAIKIGRFGRPKLKVGQIQPFQNVFHLEHLTYDSFESYTS